MFRSFDDKARSEVSLLPINYQKHHQASTCPRNVLKNLFKLFRLYFVNIIKVADCFFCHWFIFWAATRVQTERGEERSGEALMEIFQSLQCINISICVLPPPSLTVMWYWKSFYLFLISTVREATLLHQSDLCIGLSLNLLFSSFSPVKVGQSCHLSPCHDSEEEIRKILWLPARKLDISIHRVWRQPDSHYVTMSLMVCLSQ